MSKTRSDKLKRFLSLICSLILCIGIFSVADLKALQAEAATSIYLNNGRTVRSFSLGGTAVSYTIVSDPSKMINSISVSNSTAWITTYDNYTSSKKTATVKFYNKNGNLVQTATFYQDRKYVSLSQTTPEGGSFLCTGGSCTIYIHANCRVTASSSNITVQANSLKKYLNDVSSRSLQKSGNSFGFCTEYSMYYTAQVTINVPTRLVQNPDGIGTANGATGGGITFSGGRDCHPVFSWGQESAKVTMTFTPNWYQKNIVGMSESTLTGQIPYPGTTVYYKPVWNFVAKDGVGGYTTAPGIKVVYNGSYGSGNDGTAFSSNITGTLYIYTTAADGEGSVNGGPWQPFGTVSYNYYDKTLTYTSSSWLSSSTFVFNVS